MPTLFSFEDMIGVEKERKDLDLGDGDIPEEGTIGVHGEEASSTVVAIGGMDTCAWASPPATTSVTNGDVRDEGCGIEVDGEGSGASKLFQSPA